MRTSALTLVVVLFGGLALIPACGDEESAEAVPLPSPTEDSGTDTASPSPEASPEPTVEAGPETGPEAGIPTPKPSWYRGAGTEGSVDARAVTTDATGNVYVTGIAQGDVDVGGGVVHGASSENLFVAKFDAQGQHVWSHAYGTSGSGAYQGGTAIAVDSSGNVFVGGYCQYDIEFGATLLHCSSSRDIVLAKLSPSGTPLWAKTWAGEGNAFVAGLGVDDAGRVHIVGDLDSDIDFGGGVLTSKGYYDAFLATFDAQGSHVRSREFGTPAGELFVDGIAVTPSGEAVVTGWFTDSTDLGLGAQNAQADSGSSFVVKYDAQGAPAWQLVYAAKQDQGDLILRIYGTQPAIDSNGVTWLAGFSEGPLQLGNSPEIKRGAFLAGLSSAGNVLHASSNITAEDANPWALAVQAGRVAIAGRYKGDLQVADRKFTSKGEDDAFAATFDVGTGKPTGIISLGGTDFDWIYGAALAPSGALAVVGRLPSELDVGGGMISKSSEGNVFLVQYQPALQNY